MSIKQAFLSDLSIVKKITEVTIAEIYPRYYPNPDKPEKFILYISPLCYSKEKGGFPLCYLRINTSIKFTASLPVMTA